MRRRSTDVQLVGLVGLDLATASRTAEQSAFPRVATAATLDELLGHTSADAVINVTVPGRTPRSACRPC
jgi:predicted dehydrogenase